MTLYPPLYQQADSYSAQTDRQLLDALVAAGGIVLATDLAVSQRAAGANMSVDVAPGKVVVAGTDTANQGKYLCWSDAVVNVPIAAAPPAGQSRIDLIVAQVRDATVIGGANNDWTIAAVTGLPAATGTQVAPAAPASSVVLAQIAVGPTVANILTANITDQRSQIGLRTGAGNQIWAGVPFAGGWSNFAGGYQLAQYMKDAAGWVHLRGLALYTGATIVAGATAIIGTLPAGFRPALNEVDATVQGAGASSFVARIDVFGNGQIQFTNSSTAGFPSGGWVSLSGVAFVQAQ